MKRKLSLSLSLSLFLVEIKFPRNANTKRLRGWPIRGIVPIMVYLMETSRDEETRAPVIDFERVLETLARSESFPERSALLDTRARVSPLRNETLPAFCFPDRSNTHRHTPTRELARYKATPRPFALLIRDAPRWKRIAPSGGESGWKNGFSLARKPRIWRTSTVRQMTDIKRNRIITCLQWNG